MIKELKKKDFFNAFDEVHNKEEKIIVIQSGILSFAEYLECEVSQIQKYLIDIIFEYFGKHTTILFPSFTASFARTKKYDLFLSKPDTGILPTYCIKKKLMKRTRQPLTSFLVSGPLENEILEIKCKTSWGDESIYGWLQKKNALWIALGVNWSKGCAFFHRSEEFMKVPYRYFKSYKGDMFNNGKKIGVCEETKFSYSLNVKPIFDLYTWIDWLYDTKQVRKSFNKKLILESVKVNSILEAGKNFFSYDPYGFIKNKLEVKNWVKNDKLNEIKNLPKNEQTNLN